MVLLMGLARPSNDWDMIGYVAAALYKDGYRNVELSERTYAAIRANVTEAQFRSLTEDHYRGVVFKDPVSLEQHIPLYSIRVAYVELIRRCGHFGWTYPQAAHLISAVFSVLSVLVIATILVENKVSIIMLPVIVALAGVVGLARLPTPDAMACCFSLLAVACGSKRRLLLPVWLVSLPFVRTDFILLSCLLGAYDFLRGNRLIATLSVLLSIMAYTTINIQNDHYGWLVIVNFTLLGITPYPAELVPSPRLMDYLGAYYSAVVDWAQNARLHLFIYVLAVYTLLTRRNTLDCDSQLFTLVMIPLAFVVLHLVLFPAYMPRFFAFTAALISIWLLTCLSGDRAMRQ